MSIVPIKNLSRRLPEAGRLRMGRKGPKGQPQAIPTWRATSHDRAALEQIAALYGGEVVPWSDPKAAEGQFEVITTSSELRVVLPPDPLGDSPIYELWSGGGCARRCNGESATVLQQGSDGLEPVDVPCICDAKGVAECNVITRLGVLLPEIRFTGVWRLDTKSWNAAQELPGMVDLVQQMQREGLSYAVLGIKHRRSVAGGQTKRFLYPVLGIGSTLEQLASGSNRLGSLPSGPSAEALPALGAGPSEGGEGTPVVTPVDSGGRVAGSTPASVASPPSDDDGVVEAELVPDETTVPEDFRPPSAGAMRKLMALLKGLDLTEDDARHAWATGHLDRHVESFKSLSDIDVERLIEVAKSEGRAA